MQIHLRDFSVFNADCRTMNEALFDSHDPATVAVRLRRLECRVKCVLWTGMCMFAV